MAFEAEVATYVVARGIYAAGRVSTWDNHFAQETVARTPFAYVHGGENRVGPPKEFPAPALGVFDPETVLLDAYFPRDGRDGWAAAWAAHLELLRAALRVPAALLGTDGVWTEFRERTPTSNDASLTFGWAVTTYTITRHSS